MMIKAIVILILLISCTTSLRIPGEPRIPSQDVYELVETKDLGIDGSGQITPFEKIAESDENAQTIKKEESTGNSDKSANTVVNNYGISPLISSSGSVDIQRNIKEIINGNSSKKNYLIDVEIIFNDEINSLELTELLENDLVLINKPIYAYKIESFDDACKYILNDFGCSIEPFDNAYRNKYYLEYNQKEQLFIWEMIRDRYNENLKQFYRYIIETLCLPWINKKNIAITKRDTNIVVYYNESVLLNGNELFYVNKSIGHFNKYELLCNGSKFKLNRQNVKIAKDPDIDIFLKILRNNLGIAIAKKDLLNINKKDDLIFFNFTDFVIINQTNNNFVTLTTKTGSQYNLIRERKFDINNKGIIWTYVFAPGQEFDIKIGPFHQGEILTYSYIVEPKRYGTQRLATVIEINNKNFIKKIDEMHLIDPSYTLNISMDTKNSKVHKDDEIDVEYSIKQEQAIPTKIKIDFDPDGNDFIFKDKDNYTFPIEEEIRNNPITINRKLSYLEEGEYLFPRIIVNGIAYEFDERRVNVEDLFPQVIQAFIALIMLLGIILGNIYGPLIRKNTKAIIEPNLKIIMVGVAILIIILLYYISNRFFI